MKKIFCFTLFIGIVAIMISCANESENKSETAGTDQTDAAATQQEAKANVSEPAGQKAQQQAPEKTKPTGNKSTAGSQTKSSAPTKPKSTASTAAKTTTTTSVANVEIGNEVGNDLGDFESYDPDSVIRRLSDTRGQLTMMVLWNSKCGHCVSENEKYRTAYEQYHDKKFVNGDGFEIYAIGLDKVRETWVEALEEKQYPWKYNVYVLDSWKDRDIRFFGIKNLPGTFLLDENGIVLAKKFSGDELHDLLEGYLVE